MSMWERKAGLQMVAGGGKKRGAPKGGKGEQTIGIQQERHLINVTNFVHILITKEPHHGNGE
ncbi:hypothetical protein NQ317_016559 [Molorchus minor]|uniref:Uncharacterized protein n=1 Tax=Molorchus minor TaxID=1323400 RepID=A0ABQ9IZB9_9CUCU|nr:hypothetical protein NQ317_016559 [Molorchus minor]